MPRTSVLGIYNIQAFHRYGIKCSVINRDNYSRYFILYTVMYHIISFTSSLVTFNLCPCQFYLSSVADRSWCQSGFGSDVDAQFFKSPSFVILLKNMWNLLPKFPLFLNQLTDPEKGYCMDPPFRRSTWLLCCRSDRNGIILADPEPDPYQNIFQPNVKQGFSRKFKILSLILKIWHLWR